MDRGVEEARARLASSMKKSTRDQQVNVSPDQSLPSGAEAGNILGVVRDSQRSTLSHSRRLFSNSDPPAAGLNPTAGPSTAMAPISLLADRFEERLSACFNEVADGLDTLDKTKAAITEWDSRFGFVDYKQKESHVRMLSLQDARDLLCRELEKSDLSEKKMALQSQRISDLEKKLAESETYARKVFDVYYPKAHDEVAVLLAEVRAKEMELLARVEKAEGERRQFAEQNESLKERLRETERRRDQLDKDLADLQQTARVAATQRDAASASYEAAKAEIARLRKALDDAEQRIRETAAREADARQEAGRHADAARAARINEDKFVQETTREANRKLAENERRVNEEMERIRQEMAKEYQAAQARQRDAEERARQERERAERYADRVRASEAKNTEWQQRFDQRVEEMNIEMQKRIASSYREIMMGMAPSRRIGDEENQGLGLFSSTVGAVPSINPPLISGRSAAGGGQNRAQPPLPSTSTVSESDGRKRQLRQVLSNAVPPRR